MARRGSVVDKSATMQAEAASHGGLVALSGGPAGQQWHWRDEWLAYPAHHWRRPGYVETTELVTNPQPECRGYGQATVWKYDRSLVPPETAAPDVEPIPPAYCACGERLLLRPHGRQGCERCRLGVTTPASVWRPHGVAPSGPIEPPAEVVPDLVELDESTERESAPELVSQPQSTSALSPPNPAEVADFAWRNIAHLYDR